MAKITIPAMACVLIAALVLSSCPNPLNGAAGSDVPKKYFVDVNPKPANGEIILSSNFDMQSKGIQVYVLPAPGFVYKDDSLGFRNRSNDKNLKAISQVQGSYYYQFSLTGAHTEVTAQFLPNTAENMAYGADPAKNTVSIESGITNGFIVPNLNLAAPGSTVTLNIFPADGYVLDTGSFKVFEVINGQLNPAGIAVSQTMPHAFTTPLSGSDVLIRAEFVPAGFKEIAETAGNYLKTGRYDIAAGLYEAAYKKRSQAGAELDLLDEVIFYHAIGKLGAILIEGRVRELLGSGKNNLNFGSVPSTLDDWMCDIASGWPGTDERYWYEFYRGIDYTQGNGANDNRIGYDAGELPLWNPSTEKTGDVILPKISYYSGFDRMDGGAGSGFPGDFGNSPLINQTEKGRQKYWHVYFMLMLCQTRDEGLNLLLQKMDDLLFGSAFEEAASIAATLRPEAQVPLYDNLKARFRNNKGYGNTGDGLERYYGPGNTLVGKAELDFIFGMARLAKASVQYLRSYNWFILGQPWLIDETKPDNGPDQILNYAFSLAESNPTYGTLWNGSSKTDILPLRGKFLEIQKAGFIDKSRGEFEHALNLINSSVTYWFGTNLNSASKPAGSNFSQDGFQNYKWAAGGFAAALNALNSNSVFYFPRKLPAPSASARWPAASQSDYGVNMGTFFKPGVFSLKNLVITDPGNQRVPALYQVPWYYQNAADRTGFYILPRQAARVTGPIPDDDSRMVVNQQVEFMLYTIEMNMDNFRAIFPKGFEQSKYTNHYNQAPSQQFPNPDYNPDIAGKRAFLYEVFPTIPVWPERPTYLSGPGNGGNKSAQYLYKYYHNIK
jgi:predicted small secreted protein